MALPFEPTATIIPTRPAPGKKPPKQPGAPGLLGALGAAPPKPLGPAPPIVTAHGIPSIAEFNRRLEEAVGAFRQIWGYEPTPGLAFDMTKIDLDGPGYRSWLGGARTPRQASQSAAVSRVLALGPPGLGEVTQAAQDYADLQKTLGRFVGYQGGPARFPKPILGRFGVGEPARLGYDLHTNDLFFGQVMDDIRGFPGGIKLLAVAGFDDVRNYSSEVARHTVIRGLRAAGVDVDLRHRDPTFSALRGVTKAAAIGTWEMLQDPWANRGHLGFLVATLGVAGAGVPTSIVRRLSAAETALRAGGGTVPVLRALASKPLPGTFLLGVEGFQARVLLHEGWAYRALQTARLKGKQRVLESRYGQDASGLHIGDRANLLTWLFSSERTLIKAYMKEAATNFAARTAVAAEVERLTRWRLQGKGLADSLFSESRLERWLAGRHDRVAIEKAIEVMSLNIRERPWEVMVAYHERMLAGVAENQARLAERVARVDDPDFTPRLPDPEFEGVSVEAHQAHLAALHQARKYLDNPDQNLPGLGRPVTFRQLYAAAENAVNNGSEMMKIDHLGLSPETAIQHVVDVANIYIGAVKPADLRAEGLTVAEKGLLTGALTGAEKLEVLGVTKGGKVTIDLGGEQPMILNLTRGQARYVDAYLTRSKEVDKAQRRFDAAQRKYEDALLPPELEVVYVPGRREMTLDEVKARSAEVTKATTEMWDYMYESLRDAMYGSGKGASIEQARANRYGSKRKKMGRDTVSEKVNAEVAKKWRELYDYKGDNPRLIKARDLMREDARLGEILNYESVAAGARFLDEEPPPKPKMPYTVADDVAVEMVAADTELIRVTKGRIRTLEKKAASTSRFETDFMVIARKTSEAEKHGKLTAEEAALLRSGDWKAFSRKRGYTEAEIADYQRFMDMVEEGRRLGYTDDELISMGFPDAEHVGAPAALEADLARERAALAELEAREPMWQPVRGAAVGPAGARDQLGTLLMDQKGKLERLAEKMDDRLQAKARLLGELVRAEEREGYARGFAPFHLPRSSVGMAPKTTIGAISPGARASAFGIRDRPDPLAELSHQFTGEVIRVGDTQLDSSGFAFRSVPRVARMVGHVELQKSLWAIGNPYEPGTRVPKGFIFVRDTKQITDELRRYTTGINEGNLRASLAAQLRDSDVDDFYRYAFPGAIDKKHGHPVLSEAERASPAGTFRIADERFLLNTPRQLDFWRQIDRFMTGQLTSTEAGMGGRALSLLVGMPLRVANEVYRDLNLFLKPAYILNALGAAVQTVIQQGFLAPQNLGRAVSARHWLGKDGVDQLRVGAGIGRTASYRGPWSRLSPSEYLFKLWQPLTDDFFRISAYIYELRRQGIRSREDTRRALGLEGRIPPELAEKAAEASRRAKRAMIDFELSPMEAATLRNIFFVYAFTSRSLVWSLNTLADHPVMTGALSQLGQLSEEELDKVIGDAPIWLKRQSGFVPSGLGPDGKPLLRNWNQLSVMTTWNEVVYAANGLFRYEPYDGMEDLIGGAARLLVSVMSGRDRYGATFEEGRLVGAVRELGEDTALGALIRRYRERDDVEEPLGPVPLIGTGDDLGLPRMFLTRENKMTTREHPVLDPTSWWQPWVIGGAAERTYEAQAAAARFWRDAPEAEKRAHETKLIMDGLRYQAEALGRPIPEQVRLAVRVAIRVSLSKGEFEKLHGITASKYEQVRIWVGSLRNEGVISEAEAAEYLKRAKSEQDEKALTQATLVELARRSHGGELDRWNESIRRLQEVMDPERQVEALDALKRAGIPGPSGMASADEKTRLAYARQYVAFLEESGTLTGRVADLAGDAARAARYELLAFESAADKEVTVNGVRFPSPIRVAWAMQTEAQRQATIRSLPKASWGELSSFEKALAGKPVEPTVQDGWQELERLVSSWRRENQNRPYPTEAKRRLAGELNRDARFRGILVDFDFAYRSRLRRFEVMSVYLRSENRGKWDEILLAARGFEAARKSGQWTVEAVDDAWTRVVNEKIQPWLELPENEGFKAEVDAYGATFLTGMLTR